MAAECATTAITRMARLLEVSTSGYYKRAKRSVTTQLTDREQRKADRTVKIIDHHRDSGGVYGSPRITADLRAAGEQVSEKTVAKIMHSDRGHRGRIQPGVATTHLIRPVHRKGDGAGVGRCRPASIDACNRDLVDNSGAESLWSTFKHEYYYPHVFATKSELVAAVDKWMHFYNIQRRHSVIGMLSPIAYEHSLNAAAQAA